MYEAYVDGVIKLLGARGLNYLMMKLRRNDEALLAAALTGFTWSSFGLVEVVLRTNII